MNDFLLTLFFLLVIISVYSLLVKRKKDQQTPLKNKPSESSGQTLSSPTPVSRPSELSSEINPSQTQVQPSQPSQTSKPYTSSLLPPTPTINSQNESKSLAQTIKDWGDSNSSNYIPPILNYLTHSDASIRVTATKALGRLMRTNNLNAKMRQAILALGRLTRDPVLSVRLAAVEALSKVKSPVVIPFLKVAQKDSNSQVVKRASAALTDFKGYPLKSAKKVTKKPKNVVKQLPSTST
ncbi:HEAT repeat domain-containing protein [Cyanothece sp. BG0011]|uniref:HEAT repeat domain-containing protein n=1 Tax=Cyanothece sp. BG0011 TaxID=2082950 RepID=UPI000D1D9B0B|nr:HEAT repeat domain-containing protein [Cyanothece sp. BG0011]